jgi:hypothetical protein
MAACVVCQQLLAAMPTVPHRLRYYSHHNALSAKAVPVAFVDHLAPDMFTPADYAPAAQG